MKSRRRALFGARVRASTAHLWQMRASKRGAAQLTGIDNSERYVALPRERFARALAPVRERSTPPSEPRAAQFFQADAARASGAHSCPSASGAHFCCSASGAHFCIVWQPKQPKPWCVSMLYGSSPSNLAISGTTRLPMNFIISG